MTISQTLFPSISMRRRAKPFLLACTACTFVSASAFAQSGPQISAPLASYSADMTVVSSSGGTVTSKVFTTPNSRRIETPSSNGVIVTIVNTQTREAFSYGKDANGPLGIQAAKMVWNETYKAMTADMSETPDPVFVSPEIVAGQGCNNYQIKDGTACMTSDGILLRATSDNGGKLEMINLERAAQPAYLFKVPNGYVINDMSEVDIAAGEQSSGGVQAFIENQAHKQTKKQIKKMAKKQIGNSVGGVIGGGLVGGTVGNEAGKLAKGLVGGLFGKKKKKKEEAPQELPAGEEAE